MAVDNHPSIYDELSDFIVSQPTLEAISAYRVSPNIQQYIDELLEKNGEDLLSPDERQELENILAIADVMDLAIAKAKLKLVRKV